MATGGGLKKRYINYDKINVGDLILSVKYESAIVFYSFSELYMGKNFNNTKFLYKKDGSFIGKESFSPELKKLLTKNKFLKISDGLGGKSIIRSKSIYNTFFFQFFDPPIRKFKIRDSGSYRESVESVFNFLNGIEPGAIKGEKDNGIPVLPSSTKLQNYLTSVNILRANDQAMINNMFIMRVSTAGFVVPVDLENFATSFLNIKSYNFNYPSLKQDDLPRISEVKLLEYILVQEGRKELDSGKLCYTNVSYKNKERALIPNAEIGKNNIITAINERGFTSSFIDFKKSCFPTHFKVNDEVIGILEKGIYKINDRKKLLETEGLEKDFFQNNFQKSFKYPRSTIEILVMRNGLDVSIFDKNTSANYREFAEGFYNTVSLYRPLKKGSRGKKYISDSVSSSQYTNINSFRTKLIVEFILFIRNNFLPNLRLTSKRDSRKKKIIDHLNRINRQILGSRENLFMERKQKELDLSRKNYLPKISSAKVDKEDFVFIITNIVGRRDPNQALVDFFSNPSILYGEPTGEEYPNLRLISYFVLCSKNDYCDKIRSMSTNADTQNLTFPFLSIKDGGYQMYYNKKLEIFINQDISV